MEGALNSVEDVPDVQTTAEHPETQKPPTALERIVYFNTKMFGNNAKIVVDPSLQGPEPHTPQDNPPKAA